MKKIICLKNKLDKKGNEKKKKWVKIGNTGRKRDFENNLKKNRIRGRRKNTTITTKATIKGAVVVKKQTLTTTTATSKKEIKLQHLKQRQEEEHVKKREKIQKEQY